MDDGSAEEEFTFRVLQQRHQTPKKERKKEGKPAQRRFR
jgi:hypothetical protein